MSYLHQIVSQKAGDWIPPHVPEEIPCGDMPEEKVVLKEGHIEKAKIIFGELLKQLPLLLEEEKNSKLILTICGGSGVGKSGIAGVLSYYFKEMGVGSYIMSGDNYPRRVPKYNDAERLRVYRQEALKGMIEEDVYTKERASILRVWQEDSQDANPDLRREHPWFHTYLEAGKRGLQSYLGTDQEIDFLEVEQIIEAFKNNQEEIWLKRMGREESQLWYEKVNVSETDVLILDWTHGNSDYFKGVDLPILLNSTPEETMVYRAARGRDQGVDSPFTTLVLEIEQDLLEKQAEKAKIIVSKSGELRSYQQYKREMTRGSDHE